MKNRMWFRALAFIMALSLVGCSAAKDDTIPVSMDITDNTQTEVTVSESKIDSETTVTTSAAEIASENKSETLATSVITEEETHINDEEERKKAEEEARLKAEEERKKAEEEAKIKAEEERKKAEEEARIKAEEEKKLAEQRNSFSMMSHLALTAEEIRTSKDNRVVLEDIYTSLLNDINPEAVDEITQDHLKNLRDIIKNYLHISAKKEHLNFIYNQEKASAIRNIVPDPLTILSITNSNKTLDWKAFAFAVAYTSVDSYNNYKTASERADMTYIMSGWELEQEEKDAVMKNRDRAFDYMVDMVQKYGLDGAKTLNEEAIKKFAEICTIDNASERIKLLKAEESTYSLLGNYWLELADCYFETSQYSKCLECVDKYNELSTGIYRKDYNYLQILPKAIVASKMVYSDGRYIKSASEFADAIINNTSIDDWSNRYFAAQVYLDLYSKTANDTYMEYAYKIISENVTDLLKYQRTINEAFLNEVKEQTVEEPDYRYMTAKEQKKEKQEYKEELKRVKEYNKSLKEKRKTELLSLYEPLILNCELLFAIADQKGINSAEKTELEKILQSDNNGIFLVKPINDAYSFTKNSEKYSIEFTKDKIVIPAYLLTAGSRIIVTVKENSGNQTFDDCVVNEVIRKGDTIDTFYAHYSSSGLKKYNWSADSKITVEIIYDDVYGKKISFEYYVSEFKKQLFGDKVVFTAQ